MYFILHRIKHKTCENVCRFYTVARRTYFNQKNRDISRRMVKIATPNMPLFPFVLGWYQVNQIGDKKLTLFIGNKVNLFVNTSKVNVMDFAFSFTIS